MADEDSTLESPRSLKSKIRSSLCFSCCFGFPNHRVRPRIARSTSLNNNNHTTKPSRSTDFPHLREKCCNFIARIGRHRHRRHSADFHYDALSYALNFEDATNNDRPADDIRSFSARLPASPPARESQSQTPATTTAVVGIAARN